MRLITWFRERWQRRRDYASAWDEETALLIRPDAEAATAAMPSPVPADEPAPAYTQDIMEKAAAIVRQAEKDSRAAHESAQTEAWGEWDQPDPALADKPAVELPPMPTGELSRIMVSQIKPPDPDITSYGRAHSTAEYLRKIGAATGTATDMEETGFWEPAALEPAAPGAPPGFHAVGKPGPETPGEAA